MNIPKLSDLLIKSPIHFPPISRRISVQMSWAKAIVETLQVSTQTFDVQMYYSKSWDRQGKCEIYNRHAVHSLQISSSVTFHA